MKKTGALRCSRLLLSISLSCLFDACTPAAVASHVDGQDGTAVDSFLFAEIVHCNDVCIDAVLEADHLVVLACGQEVELELEVTLSAVGDATDEPLVAFALCCDAILTCFSLENTSLVPVYWHTCEEVAAIGYNI